MTSNPPPEPAADVVPVAHAVDRLKRLTDALDVLVALPVDRLDDRGVEAELEVLERVRRRVEVRISRAASTLTSRRAAAARQAAGPDDRRAGERAIRDTRQQLMDQLDWTPTDAKDHQ
ncbi:MAG: hypothetical protein R3320_07310, partial [Nitriliruptorales bacterium]|nr:hypothetical protein [Nitriliruptorales bacterium]